MSFLTDNSGLPRSILDPIHHYSFSEMQHDRHYLPQYSLKLALALSLPESGSAATVDALERMVHGLRRLICPATHSTILPSHTQQMRLNFFDLLSTFCPVWTLSPIIAVLSGPLIDPTNRTTVPLLAEQPLDLLYYPTLLYTPFPLSPLDSLELLLFLLELLLHPVSILLFPLYPSYLILALPFCYIWRTFVLTNSDPLPPSSAAYITKLLVALAHPLLTRILPASIYILIYDRSPASITS